MDYSLLLVIEEKSKSKTRNTESFVHSDHNWLVQMMASGISSGRRLSSVATHKSGYKFESACGNFIYHLGIIDYLQKYDAWKKAERIFKVVKVSLGKDRMIKPDDISCLEPQKYRERFL
jgi:hypothetical protein